MTERCRHLHTKGVHQGTRCGQKISKLDPENRYCAKHRICVFIIDESETKASVIKVSIKYHNYITFCESLISDPNELATISELFKK